MIQLNVHEQSNQVETLKANYSQDRRKTEITPISHSISERELIPHEKRLIILSRFENKKERKINNFLTAYQVNSLEATNIPSVGKELKTRGEN